MTNITTELPSPRQPASLVNDRVQGPEVIFHEVIPSDPNLLDQVVAEIIQVMEGIGNQNDLDCIDLAVREALANAIVHGNQCDCQKIVDIQVGFNDRGDLYVIVRDSGSGFDPSKIADPTDAKNLLSHHGRGLFIMRQLMDEVELKFDHGTEVRMVRRCRLKPGATAH